VLVISHRGNQEGPGVNENDPFQLVATISNGIEVEVDVWVVNGEFFLGHDNPERDVPSSFIKDLAPYAWYHCKNIAALETFNTDFSDLRYFWHEEDRYTLTSNGYIWTYPGQEVTPKSIVVDLDLSNLDSYKGVAYAVCTDYPRKLNNE
jgi:hypothetical protein